MRILLNILSVIFSSSPLIAGEDVDTKTILSRDWGHSPSFPNQTPVFTVSET